MSGILWLAMRALADALARADLVGAAALLGLCALGAAVYGAAGALLGIIPLSGLPSLIPRPRPARPHVQAADPDGQPCRRRAAAGSTTASPARTCRTAWSPARHRHGPARCRPCRSLPGPRTPAPTGSCRAWWRRRA